MFSLTFRHSFCLLALLATALVSCGDDNSALTTDCVSSQELQPLLENYASRASILGQDFVERAEALNTAALALSPATNGETVNELRELTLAAFESYQRVSPYSPGPDLDLMVDAQANGFPLDESAVDAFLLSGMTSLSDEAMFDRGLPALDYLLFEEPEAGALAQRIASDARFRDALGVYSTHLKRQASTLLTAWVSEAADFVGREGNAAGSGLSTIVNLASKHFEDLRRDKVGTPLGVSTLNVANPQTVEARYSAKSLTLLEAGIAASMEFLKSGGSKPSLLDYIRGQSSMDAQELAADIEAQYTTILALLPAIDATLEQAVESDKDDVQRLYNALSRQVVNLKTDLPSVACVAITYVDNPSDSD